MKKILAANRSEIAIRIFRAGTELGLTQITQATNAAFTLDGLAVEQQSNTVTDVLQGVTLNLLDEGTADVVVATSKEITKENLTAFVDNFNASLKMVADALKSNENTNHQTSLVGDSTIKRLKSDLQTIVTNFGRISQKL